MFTFKAIIKDKTSHARLGKITTPHGIIDTPNFVPVGTAASVKSLSPKELKEINLQVLFGNTYHLHLHPGEDIVRKFGGLGKFMGWDGPTMTDSGGFQVFSLAGPISLHPRPTSSVSLDKLGIPAGARRGSPALATRQVSFFGDSEKSEQTRLVNITEDGVIFRSYIDGSLHTFTPEKSIEIQQKLGADIILAFDECAPHPSTHEYTKEAMRRTHNWALRSLRAFRSCHPEFISGSDPSDAEMPKQVRHDIGKQALYGIIQGGVYKDLREESAKFISKQDFDGIAVGGVSVGESKKEMRDVLDWIYPHLPENKPRHLLGIGEIDDIFDAVERGMDTFDCVVPTRFGRYGIILVSPPLGNMKNRFRFDISKSEFEQDKNPLDENCKCYVCQNFTRAYIHHLFKVKELLAYRLATYHNVYFIVDLMREIRKVIGEGRFEKLKKRWLW